MLLRTTQFWRFKGSVFVVEMYMIEVRTAYTRAMIICTSFYLEDDTSSLLEYIDIFLHVVGGSWYKIKNIIGENHRIGTFE